MAKSRTLGPSTYVWRTPHGRWLLVDDTGTHHIDEELGRALTDGSPMECELVAMVHQHGKNTDVGLD